MTGSGDGRQIADEVRTVVKEEVGLTLSVGVSFNKVFAKLGSDYKKPDATTVISRENFREIVWPLPVSVLLYAGKAATKALEKLGIITIGQLAACSAQVVSEKLGKLGETLHDYACGRDDSPVAVAGEHSAPKSVGNGMTFRRNLVGLDDIRAGVAALSDSVASRLRRCGMKCGTVQVTIRDPAFKNDPAAEEADIANTPDARDQRSSAGHHRCFVAHGRAHPHADHHRAKTHPGGRGTALHVRRGKRTKRTASVSASRRPWISSAASTGRTRYHWLPASARTSA